MQKRNLSPDFISRNLDIPKSDDTFILVPSDGECFAVVTPADDGLAQTAADIPERAVIAFKVFNDGRRPQPVTLCGTHWPEFHDAWAIRDANGRAVDDFGVLHRCARSFLSFARRKRTQ